MNEIILGDYEEKYANIINELEYEQWGELGIGDISDEIGPNTHIKLAKINDKIIGVGYGKQIGDLFYLQAIVIKPNYQHQNAGSTLMEYFIDYAKKLKLNNIVCECILKINKMNAEKLMKKYNFKEILRIKDYWGYKNPNIWCKECENKPCRCTGVIFVKELN